MAPPVQDHWSTGWTCALLGNMLQQCCASSGLEHAAPMSTETGSEPYAAAPPRAGRRLPYRAKRPPRPPVLNLRTSSHSLRAVLPSRSAADRLHVSWPFRQPKHCPSRSTWRHVLLFERGHGLCSMVPRVLYCRPRVSTSAMLVSVSGAPCTAFPFGSYSPVLCSRTCDHVVSVHHRIKWDIPAMTSP